MAQHVPLLANIGTSSSYCMPAFGSTSGKNAVGVYAWQAVGLVDQPSGLRPDARSLLQRANDAYYEKWDQDMSPAALAGFSAAWAFFTDVLPQASSLAPKYVAAAARAVDLPRGSLPNGSGLLFGAPGTPNAGDNVAAASVTWKWVAPGEAAVIWPPASTTRWTRTHRTRGDPADAVVAGVGFVTSTARSPRCGHLSSLAKGPLLDGIGPPQPYRWVNPPPDLAATNQPPWSGVFHVPLKVGGSAQTAP